MTAITPSRLLAALAAAAPIGVSVSSGKLSLAPAAALAKHGADDRNPHERHGRGGDDRKPDDRGRGGHGRDD